MADEKEDIVKTDDDSGDDVVNIIDLDVDFKFEGLLDRYQIGSDMKLKAYAEYDKELVENPVEIVKWFKDDVEVGEYPEFIIDSLKEEDSGQYSVTVELAGDNINTKTKTVDFKVKMVVLSDLPLDRCIEVVTSPQSPHYGDLVKLTFKDTGFTSEVIEEYGYVDKIYFINDSIDKFNKFINEEESVMTDKGVILVLDDVPFTEEYIGDVQYEFEYNHSNGNKIMVGDSSYKLEPMKKTIDMIIKVNNIKEEYEEDDVVEAKVEIDIKDENIIDQKVTTRWYKGKNKLSEGETFTIEATKDNSGDYECRVLVEGKYNFPTEKSVSFNIKVKDVKPPEPEPSPEIDDDEFKFIEMPHREAVFAYLPFWAMAEISHAKENGIDWETDFAELKFAGIAGTLAELYKKYKIVELQESRNGKLITTKEKIEKGYYNINF